eukprot:2835661-Rhodomonas_salina.3
MPSHITLAIHNAITHNTCYPQRLTLLPRRFEHPAIESEEACMAACLKVDACRAIGFEMESGHCFLQMRDRGMHHTCQGSRSRIWESKLRG